MPLEPPDEQYWQAAVGYVELGMFQDANDQLEKIDPFSRAAPEVLAVRLAIYHGLKKWELMREIAKRLADFQPDDIQWVTSYAYATRRANQFPQPRKFSSTQSRNFPKSPSLNTIWLATFARWETSKTPKII